VSRSVASSGANRVGNVHMQQPLHRVRGESARFVSSIGKDETETTYMVGSSEGANEPSPMRAVSRGSDDSDFTHQTRTPRDGDVEERYTQRSLESKLILKDEVMWLLNSRSRETYLTMLRLLLTVTQPTAPEEKEVIFSNPKYRDRLLFFFGTLTRAKYTNLARSCDHYIDLVYVGTHMYDHLLSYHKPSAAAWNSDCQALISQGIDLLEGIERLSTKRLTAAYTLLHAASRMKNPDAHILFRCFEPLVREESIRGKNMAFKRLSHARASASQFPMYKPSKEYWDTIVPHILMYLEDVVNSNHFSGFCWAMSVCKYRKPDELMARFSEVLASDMFIKDHSLVALVLSLNWEMELPDVVHRRAAERLAERIPYMNGTTLNKLTRCVFLIKSNVPLLRILENSMLVAMRSDSWKKVSTYSISSSLYWIAESRASLSEEWFREIEASLLSKVTEVSELRSIAYIIHSFSHLNWMPGPDLVEELFRKILEQIHVTSPNIVSLLVMSMSRAGLEPPQDVWDAIEQSICQNIAGYNVKHLTLLGSGIFHLNNVSVSQALLEPLTEKLRTDFDLIRKEYLSGALYLFASQSDGLQASDLKRVEQHIIERRDERYFTDNAGPRLLHAFLRTNTAPCREAWDILEKDIVDYITAVSEPRALRLVPQVAEVNLNPNTEFFAAVERVAMDVRQQMTAEELSSLIAAYEAFGRPESYNFVTVLRQELFKRSGESV